LTLLRLSSIPVIQEQSFPDSSLTIYQSRWISPRPQPARVVGPLRDLPQTGCRQRNNLTLRILQILSLTFFERMPALNVEENLLFDVFGEIGVLVAGKSTNAFAGPGTYETVLQ